MGIGGGSIMTPMLVLAGVKPHVAAASSLFAILGTGLGGIRRLLREGLVDMRVGSVLAASAFAGAVLGAGVAIHLPEKLMLLVIALAMYIAAISTLYKLHVRTRHPLLLGALVTMAGTALSAMAGKGGGSFAVTILVAVLGMEPRRAAATSRLVILASAATSVTVYAAVGYLDPRVALPLIAGTYTGSNLASRLLPRMHHASHKKLAVAIYVVMGTVALAKMLA